MNAYRYLNMPMDEANCNTFFDMTDDEQNTAFDELLNNFHDTYKNGTSVQTLHTINFLVFILQSRYRKYGDIIQNRSLLSRFFENVVQYRDFALLENAPFELRGVEESKDLLVHGDNLGLALEYGFDEIQVHLKDATLEHVQRNVVADLLYINYRYFLENYERKSEISFPN